MSRSDRRKTPQHISKSSAPIATYLSRVLPPIAGYAHVSAAAFTEAADLGSCHRQQHMRDGNSSTDN